ncbi:hypothetical protein KSF73_00855 [Burkholderiaceae bacterium DAT-1]|nr:hypothetical protein [Burkholderiaceae bacterium DAT-1]
MSKDIQTRDGIVQVWTQPAVQLGVSFNNYEDEAIVEEMVRWLESDDELTLTRRFMLSDVIERVMMDETDPAARKATLTALDTAFADARGRIAALLAE